MNRLEVMIEKKLHWRALWRVVWACVTWMPKSCSPLRVMVLRLFGARIGRRCLVCAHVKVLIPWNLDFGDIVSIGEGVDLYSFSPITIGDHAIISQRSFLCTGSHDYSLLAHPLISRPITIGPRAWICSESFLHPGVAIGEGAVIGARSVVAKDMPAWMVCAGNPCRAIKPRVITDLPQAPGSPVEPVSGKPEEAR